MILVGAAKELCKIIEPLQETDNDMYKKIIQLIRKTSRALDERAKRSNATSNSLFQLHAYRHNDMWVFDDAERNLVAEPFVQGADVLFDIMSGNVLPGIDNTKCSIVFSANPIPNHDIHVKHVEDLGVGNGDVYEVAKGYNIEGFMSFTGFQFWLCPALLAFFAEAPKDIYVSVVKVS